MALGQGLHSLIPPKGSREEKRHEEKPSPSFDTPPRKEVEKMEEKKPGESVFQIEVNKISPNPYQPRNEFKEEGLEELARSIREFGVLQPLVAVKITKDTERGTEIEYQLIAGERRLKAAKRAGLERVPVIIRGSETAKRKLELALIENLQRSDLNPIESAKAYARLQDEFGLTQREVADRVGKSREAVANTMRLLNLPPEMQAALSLGRMNESQARTLLSISNPQKQREAFESIISGRARTVRSIQENVKEAKQENPEIRYWEKRLEEKFGATAKIQKSGGRGKILFHFYSQEELDGILDRMAGED